MKGWKVVIVVRLVNFHSLVQSLELIDARVVFEGRYWLVKNFSGLKVTGTRLYYRLSKMAVKLTRHVTYRALLSKQVLQSFTFHAKFFYVYVFGSHWFTFWYVLYNILICFVQQPGSWTQGLNDPTSLKVRNLTIGRHKHAFEHLQSTIW